MKDLFIQRVPFFTEKAINKANQYIDSKFEGTEAAMMIIAFDYVLTRIKDVEYKIPMELKWDKLVAAKKIAEYEHDKLLHIKRDVYSATMMCYTVMALQALMEYVRWKDVDGKNVKGEI